MKVTYKDGSSVEYPEATHCAEAIDKLLILDANESAIAEVDLIDVELYETLVPAPIIP